MKKQSKGQLEAQISNAMSRFEKDHLGRGPKESRAYIIQDMILVRLKGILTPAEQDLAAEKGGAHLIKEIRTRLIETSRPLLDQIIKENCGCGVRSLHTDISSRSGERIFVFVLERNLEQDLEDD
jgi:uncharacterized protein YbcI